MKIKDALPQFNDSSAILIVTGKERAKFYFVRDGEIEELESIEVEQDEYRSDREGRFEPHIAGGSVVGGRSVEEHGEAEVKKFLDQFEKHIPSLLSKYEPDSLYLFSPSYIANGVEDKIPRNQQSLIEERFSGDYRDKHPFDLLEMILSSMQEKTIEPKSEEAQKIYDKFPEDKE